MHSSTVRAPLKNASSNLSLHLQTWHRKIYDELSAMDLSGRNVSARVDEILAEANKQQNRSRIMEQYTDPLKTQKVQHQLMVLFWLMDAALPFSTVENKFYRLAHPEWKPFSRESIRRLLSVAREIVAAKIKSVDLRGIRFFSVTTDTWTDAKQVPYAAVTYHYLNYKLELQAKTLDLAHFPGPHTATAITAKLEQLISYWMDDDSLLIAAIGDGAASVRAGLKDLVGEDGLWCFAHQLQLCMKDFCKDPVISAPISSIRSVVTSIKNSGARIARLHALQKLRGIAPKKVIQDVATRFSSTFLMLERFLELADDLRTVVSEIDLHDAEIPFPSREDVAKCGIICKILKPFAQITAEASTEAYPSLAMVPVWVSKLQETLQGDINLDSNLELEYKRVLSQHFTERFRSLFASPTTALCAAALHPNYAHLPFSSVSDALREEVYQRLTTEFVNACEHLASISKSRLSPMEEIFLSHAQVMNEASVRQLLDMYLKRASEERRIGSLQDKDCLQWWAKQSQFAPFAMMWVLVQVFLCIPATSVPSERAFSSAGAIDDKKRRNMTVETLETCVFLRENCQDPLALIEFGKQYAADQLLVLTEQLLASAHEASHAGSGEESM